jgi:hypothetical protein
MVTDVFPDPDEHLAETRRQGVRLDDYNKLNIFRPDALLETNFAVGRHTARPVGKVRYPARDRVLLFHYKFLGKEYLRRRYAQLDARRGEIDQTQKWGHQYARPPEELDREFEDLRRRAIDVRGRSARRLNRRKWWRPEPD